MAGLLSYESCGLLAYILESGSGYLSVYAVILFILALPRAQRETIIAETNRLIVMMAPCLVCEHFNCYGLDMGRECGGFQPVLHTLLSGDRQSTLPY